ncbi:MAG: glycosyltransferase family 39 protein [Saprospiraceae bacterium]
MKLDEHKIHLYLIVAIILVHFMGLFVDVMDIDASQYASIAQEMVQDGQWLQLYHRQMPYLDKPPLLFWLSAFSFKIFGVSNFAYKFPSFLFALLTIFSTYKLTKYYYGNRAGLIAAIIIGSVQGLYSITLDVRTDSILIGSVTFAIWQLSQYIEKQNYKNLFLGSIGIALAMLAKGPIGIMVPFLAIGGDVLMNRQWKVIFKWQWIIGLGTIALILSPMTYGLYTQFDSHPEIFVNGKTGVSGVYFYFWEQSFGRLTGENVWSNNAGPFFFIHTLLWAFLPWTLILIPALVDRLRNYRKKSKYSEYISIFGFLLPFIAFSISKYKLPHYIFVVFPLAAMLLAAYIDKIKKTNFILKYGQFAILGLLWIIAFVLLFYVFTPVSLFVASVSIALLGLVIWIIIRLKNFKAVVFATAITAIGINLILNGHTYPSLLTYQSTSIVGKWLKDHPKEKIHFTCFKKHMHAIDFQGGKTFSFKSSISELTFNDKYLYTDDIGLLELENGNISYKIIQAYEDFAVTRLNIKFLNPKSRKENIRNRYLIEINHSKMAQ